MKRQIMPFFSFKILFTICFKVARGSSFALKLESFDSDGEWRSGGTPNSKHAIGSQHFESMIIVVEFDIIKHNTFLHPKAMLRWHFNSVGYGFG
ncbi:hypothetical protein BDZ97DRAFT_53194 [Flammula alnicola]|nr:hypothetical protein BDZ97DRAFT_53194 [Flammula alnicola]